jgi:hypothetical protein
MKVSGPVPKEKVAPVIVVPAVIPDRARVKVAGRTPEGLEHSRRANWKHGYYSREAKAERSRVRAAILALRYLRMLGH